MQIVENARLPRGTLVVPLFVSLEPLNSLAWRANEDGGIVKFIVGMIRNGSERDKSGSGK